ncbi:MAG TPA: ABC transporter permease [Candidatus Paceibacterota bacterium]
MIKLTIAFLKIFFRNGRAIFFAIFLPSAIFSILALLNLEGIIRFGDNVSYSDYLLVGMIALAVMQTGIYTASYSLIDLRRTNVLRRLSVTPLSPAQFLGAQVAARFVVACLQGAVLLTLGALVFDVSSQNLWAAPVLIFFGSAIFLNFGFLIASIARDYEEAAPYTSIVGLTSMFLGDVFFPVANLPPQLARLADFLPLKPLSQSLRYFLLGVATPELAQDLLILVGWFVLTFLFSRFVFAKRVYR